ncbi:MAG: hypothetical protein JKY65_12490 [Planctomycetes bacterium]|nr:hypothetical protein [Planctomycetota bacterium]
MLFCSIMSRVPGRKNDALLNEKGGRGFPYLVYMDAAGEVIGKPSGRTVGAFRKTARYLTLKNKKDRSTSEEVELIQLGLAMGKLDPDKAKEQAAALKLNGAQKALIKKAIKVAVGQNKARALLGQVKSQSDVQSKGAQVGEKLWALYQEGVRFGPGAREGMSMAQLIMTYGLSSKKLEPAEAGLKDLKIALAGNRRAQGFLKQMEQQVEALRGSK